MTEYLFPEARYPCKQEWEISQSKRGLACKVSPAAWCLWHSARHMGLISVPCPGHILHILSHLYCVSPRVAPLTGGSPAGIVGFNPLSRPMPIRNSWKLELGWINVVKILFLMAPSLGHQRPSGGKLWGWGSVNVSSRYYNSVEHTQIVQRQKMKQGKMSNSKWATASSFSKTSPTSLDRISLLWIWQTGPKIPGITQSSH